jgi:transposase InsO family protein
MPWKKTEPMSQKAEFVLRAMSSSSNFRELCREYGIAAKTGYKWKQRFMERGLEGLGEESRRPRSSPEALEEGQVCAIIRIKQRHPHWGPRKIQELYRREFGQAPSESSFKRVLERAGLVEKRRVRAAREGGRISSGKRAQGPNEVWTIDFKGKWHDGLGECCEPLTVRDEYSRYILASERLKNARTETVWKSLEGLFEQHGLPGAIRSDNGAPFASVRGVLGLSRLSSRWVAMGIDLERSRPGCPQDNGGHERMHRDLSSAFEQQMGESSQAELDLWRQEFNWQRPHESLGMKCPGEVYENSLRPYQGVPEKLEYPAMETRRILVGGSLMWQGQAVFISSALRGWEVGLRPCGRDRWEIYFANLRLGELEPSTASFIRTPWRANETGSIQPETVLP